MFNGVISHKLINFTLLGEFITDYMNFLPEHMYNYTNTIVSIILAGSNINA